MAESSIVPTEGPSYKRLTDAERVSILTLHDKGETLTAIAQRLNRSMATIHDVLKTYAPTIDLAKRRLQANAERMAQNVVDNGLPRDHVATLKGLGVLEDQQQQGVTVIVGGSGTVNLGIALSPQVSQLAGESE